MVWRLSVKILKISILTKIRYSVFIHSVSTRHLIPELNHIWNFWHISWNIADDVNILEGSIHTLKENAEALVAAAREIGLELSADKTKYMVMSRDQNAGGSHSVRIDNSSIERVEEFKYLGTTLTNQNSVPEEIKSKLRSGNACYHSV